MYTTVNEEGLLNNYAPTTRIHYAEYPAVWEQRRYMVQGAIACAAAFSRSRLYWSALWF